VGRNGDQSLEVIIRDFKKFTSTEILKSIQTTPDESRKDFLLYHFRQAGMKNSNNTN
tara:strand:- start:33 stop:203 length:171 start_codon:yes stop_codon:yes gene_type:complete